MSRESSLCRGNVREHDYNNEASRACKRRVRPRNPARWDERRTQCPALQRGQPVGPRTKTTQGMRLANFAGSGEGSITSIFWSTTTPPIGSLTMSETTVLATL
jgi:hypothetical protein